MAFGKPFAKKPSKAEPPRPMTGSLVRIVVLGLLSVLGAAWGLYMYYTHSFRPKPKPHPAASAPASNEVEIELVPSPSASSR